MYFSISCENTIFKFSRNNPPVLRVPSGSTVLIETKDCFSNHVQTPQDTLLTMEWDKVNPATGPIFIESALPGDVLKVSIEKIVLHNQGVMASGDTFGVLSSYLGGLESKLIPIENNKALFDAIEIPIKPMIGVIGVSPSQEDVNTGTPGSHGGNMDNTMICEGAVIYFPIYVEGALFALGDLHAVMGNGEIGGTGVEIPGNVTAKLEVIKDRSIHNPILENKDYITTIASSETLDDAANQATIDMAMLLKDTLTFSMNDLAMLMSIVGHTEICQIVDPLKTARFLMPKEVLNKYNFSPF